MKDLPLPTARAWCFIVHCRKPGYEAISLYPRRRQIRAVCSCWVMLPTWPQSTWPNDYVSKYVSHSVCTPCFGAHSCRCAYGWPSDYVSKYVPHSVCIACFGAHSCRCAYGWPNDYVSKYIPIVCVHHALVHIHVNVHTAGQTIM